tara:strand:- start:327 stop:1151 length:825 start_codon:yes stop_codon:yes gene_type:complete
MLIAEMEVSMTVDARHSPNREDFIRGSDMVSLMQGKWNELYKIKMGQIGRKDLSHLFNVNLGTFTESFNMDWAKQNYDYKFANQVPFKKQYGSINLQGTLDGYDYENKVLIECKHTHSRNDMETVIDFYMPQIQFYMYLSGAKQGLLSVIFGNTYDAVVVDASDEYQTLMLDRIKMFWECVVHGNEPDDVATVVDKLMTNKIPINGKTKRDVSKSNSFTSNTDAYIHYETANKLFEEAKKGLKAEIGDDEAEIYNDLICVKRDKRGSIRITKKG